VTYRDAMPSRVARVRLTDYPALLAAVEDGVSGEIEQTGNQLTAPETLYLMLCTPASEIGLTPEMLGLTSEDLAAAAAATPDQPSKRPTQPRLRFRSGNPG
jgi:hypothetical protein